MEKSFKGFSPEDPKYFNGFNPDAEAPPPAVKEPSEFKGFNPDSEKYFNGFNPDMPSWLPAEIGESSFGSFGTRVTLDNVPMAPSHPDIAVAPKKKPTTQSIEPGSFNGFNPDKIEIPTISAPAGETAVKIDERKIADPRGEIRAPEPRSIVEEAGAGLKRGAQNLGQIALGATALAADVFGSDAAAEAILKQYINNAKNISSGTVGSLENVGGYGDFGRWAVEKITENIAKNLHN